MLKTSLGSKVDKVRKSKSVISDIFSTIFHIFVPVFWVMVFSSLRSDVISLLTLTLRNSFFCKTGFSCLFTALLLCVSCPWSPVFLGDNIIALVFHPFHNRLKLILRNYFILTELCFQDIIYWTLVNHYYYSRSPIYTISTSMVPNNT